MKKILKPAPGTKPFLIEGIVMLIIGIIGLAAGFTILKDGWPQVAAFAIGAGCLGSALGGLTLHFRVLKEKKDE